MHLLRQDNVNKGHIWFPGKQQRKRTRCIDTVLQGATIGFPSVHIWAGAVQSMRLKDTKASGVSTSGTSPCGIEIKEKNILSERIKHIVGRT
jgi:hypothetical protein